MELQTVCPWCETNIIWDEEIGPEKYCPHCDNEISGYRTLEFDTEIIEGDYAEDENELYKSAESADDWEDEDSSILRSTREIAANSQLQELLDRQFEMPECTNCREYMLEIGEQSIGQQGEFIPVAAPKSGLPIVRTPLKVSWYVCPSCYRTDSYLSVHDRKHMLDALSNDE